MSISSPLLPLLLQLLLLVLVLVLLWRLPLLLVLLLGGGGGAVAVAITVAVDCRYGCHKSNLPVMKIRKKNKRKYVKNVPRTWRHICVSSPPFPTQYSTIACPQCVGDGSCGPWELGGTWW